jgi:NAD(P)-dependent dehydrogenase (short-subunit alcohol dehydrogenase family)
MALDFDDLMLEHGYNGTRAYCQSKLAQILFTLTLAEELQGSQVTVTALHPATYMPTKIVPSPTSTLEEGVQATMRLIADPELAEVTGAYFNRTRQAEPDRQALNPAARQALENASRELLAAHDGGR